MMFNFVWAKTLINENKTKEKSFPKKKTQLRSWKKRKEHENENIKQHFMPISLSIVLYANSGIYGISGGRSERASMIMKFLKLHQA